MKYSISILIIGALFISCGSKKPIDKRITLKDSIPADKKTEMKSKIPELQTEFSISRDAIFATYLNRLKEYLKEGKVAPFFNDECLDSKNLNYGFVNHHEYVSLRKDLIDKLSLIEVKKLLTIGVDSSLDITCNDLTFSKTLPYFSKSTRMLLNERIGN